jgi:vacuolar-type H+-ATPase subunit E/Vma4
MNLRPLRESLVAHANGEARALVQAAERDADQRREAARAEAAALLRAAGADRQAAADAARSRRLLNARREAAGTVLAAQREAYEQLQSAARAAATGLRDGPEYPRLRRSLAAAARRQLGPDAELTEPETGGIVARKGGRLVDYSLRALADRGVSGLGSDLGGLWR